VVASMFYVLGAQGFKPVGFVILCAEIITNP